MWPFSNKKLPILKIPQWKGTSPSGTREGGWPELCWFVHDEGINVTWQYGRSRGVCGYYPQDISIDGFVKCRTAQVMFQLEDFPRWLKSK